MRSSETDRDATGQSRIGRCLTGRGRLAPVALWAVAVVVGLGAGALLVTRLVPLDRQPAGGDSAGRGSAIVPVPGVNPAGDDSETARVLLPTGTPARAPTQGGAVERWAGARVAIPKLELDAPIVEGVDLAALSSGVGHWPGTALPGRAGNMVLAGHRTTHGAPFSRLDELTVGDEVTVTFGGASEAYRVTGTEIVDPDRLDVARPTAASTATLFACHPPGSAQQRIVVRLASAP
ncbi:MAG: class E sortase [Microthrixaceae bacterium]